MPKYKDSHSPIPSQPIVSGITPKVVIIGAGFGGLALAEKLKDQPFSVEILDKRNHHLFQPLLYQVATAGLEPNDISSAVRGVVHRWKNVNFTAADVNGIDRERKVVKTASGREISYDYLVIAAGTETNDFGTPGVQEYGFTLKSLPDSTTLRNHLIDQFEIASTDPVDAKARTSVVVVGGGPTGVELAGALGELYRYVLKNDFPDLDMGKAQVTLVEATDKILSPFKRPLQKHAIRQLRKRGVNVLLKTAVKEVRENEVELADGQILPSYTCVWAAGVKAVDIGEKMGLETNRGRIVVGKDLSVKGNPEIFAIGDIAAAPTKDSRPHPQVAPVAMQMGRYVAEVLEGRRTNRAVPAFDYFDKGSMATIGRSAAVAQLPNGSKFTGMFAWILWLGLHLWFLIGYRNRMTVVINWAWNYLTWDRAARVVPHNIPTGNSKHK